MEFPLQLRSIWTPRAFLNGWQQNGCCLQDHGTQSHRLQRTPLSTVIGLHAVVISYYRQFSSRMSKEYLMRPSMSVCRVFSGKQATPMTRAREVRVGTLLQKYGRATLSAHSVATMMLD